MTANFKTHLPWLAFFMVVALLVTGCSGAGVAPAAIGAEVGNVQADVSYILRSELSGGRMLLVGQGGEIDGLESPQLVASPGQRVQITLVNGDGSEHDIALPGLGVNSEQVRGSGKTTSVTFEVHQEGKYAYYCTIAGHREAGMSGWLVVGRGAEVAGPGGPAPANPADQQTSASAPVEAAAAPVAVEAPSIVHDPADIPGPIGDRGPQTVHYEIETVELQGRLADGTSFTYWTFDGKVPGPFLRVREGDTVEIRLSNTAESMMTHSIDLHAVTGPGGGAAVTQVLPGETKAFTFKALSPGLYVYHCATPMVAHHISSGMYGLILVEPEGGLPEVDREYYVMQGEIYTTGAFGAKGEQQTDINKLLAEDPDYLVFNGSVGALTAEFPLQAQVGETVRIFMGVGGPNFISSFHVIGEIFDRVYDQASLTSAPLTDVQTTLVPPGGATMVEFAVEVPGRYILVDHSLSRLEHGLAGFLVVEGPDNPEVFFSENASDGSH